RLEIYDTEGRIAKSIVSNETNSGSGGKTVTIFDVATGKVAERHEYDAKGAEKTAAHNAAATGLEADGAASADGVAGARNGVATDARGSQRSGSAISKAEASPARPGARHGNADKPASPAIGEKKANGADAAQKAAADKAARKAAIQATSDRMRAHQAEAAWAADKARRDFADAVAAKSRKAFADMMRKLSDHARSVERGQQEASKRMT